MNTFHLILIILVGFYSPTLHGFIRKNVRLWKDTHTINDTKTQAIAVRNLIQRVLPQYSNKFIVRVAEDGKGEGFQLQTMIKKNYTYVIIRATSKPAASLGFHHYLTQYGRCQFTWDYRQCNLPYGLPTLSQPVSVKDLTRWRYYGNICTHSYSFVWWNWTQWEEHIDWAAMHGINLFLAPAAQEYIYKEVFLSLGVLDSELDGFFAGPAFLAWSRMGNLRGWPNPLSRHWHTQQRMLQHQILNRLRSLGITPVTPAFGGYVPHALTQLYNVRYTFNEHNWNKFPAKFSKVYLLNVTDPLFTKIASMFLKLYIREFGTSNVYSADTFNEMTPPSWTRSYLQRCGHSSPR